MIKSVLCCILVCAITTISFDDVGAAQSKGCEEGKEAEVYNFTIEELYQLRSILAMDYDFYEEQIAEIDRKLEVLGVEEISQSEVEAKLGLVDEYAIQPCYDVTPASDIKWTSKREYYVYRGKSYELQVIRGVPNGSTGRLIIPDGQAKKASSDYGFKAASKNLTKILVNYVAGYLPQLGGTLSTAQTFYDAYKGIISGLTPTTSIGAVECTYTTSILANYVYVFIKYSGDVDEGNQILAYTGNWIHYTTKINTPGAICVNGQWLSEVFTTKLTGTITSPYYNGYRDVASNVFWEYNNGNPHVPTRYDTYKFRVQMLDDTITLTAPYVFPY